MKVLRWLDKHFEECSMFANLWIIVCLSTIQIIMRYLFKNSLSWPEEMNRYLFIWFAYIGLSYAVRYSCHTRIDIFETLVPKLKKGLSVVCDLGLLFFSVYMIGPGWTVVSQLHASNQTSSAMGLPMYVVYFSLLAGLVLMLFRLAQKYILLLLAARKHKKEVSDG